MPQFDLISVLAGLGLFLYGMSVLENSIKVLAGNNLKNLLESATKSRIYSILTGFIATAILQSSTIVTILALSFVGAGLMSLSGGIGVVFGSNLGTAFSTAIISVLGFKTDIEKLVLPLLGLAGVGQLIVSKRPKLQQWCVALVGLSLLFVGLGYLKSGMQGAASAVDLSQFSNSSALIFVLIGIVLTVLVQSSTASTAILLSAIQVLNLDLKFALAMIIGFNIGTTFTAIIGSMGGSADKKRVGLAHLIFNIFTSLPLLIFLGSVTEVIIRYITTDPVYAIVSFHIIFNLLGVLVLSIFIPQFSSILKFIIKDESHSNTSFIHLVSPNVTLAALEALKKEISLYAKLVLEYNVKILNISARELYTTKKLDEDIINENDKILDFDFEKEFKELQKIESEILAFLVQVNGEGSITSDELEVKQNYLESVRQLSFSASMLKDVKIELDSLVGNKTKFVREKYKRFQLRLFALSHLVFKYLEEDSDTDLRQKISDYMETIQLEDKLALSNISKAISEEKIEQSQAPQLLSLNRIVYMSSKSVIEALDKI